MTSTEIASAMSAALAFLQANPAPYPDSTVTAKLESGLQARVTSSDGLSMMTDLPPEVGGAGAFPTAGSLMRAALAACDATTIAMCAAEAGVELSLAEVTVESTSDYRGLLGDAGVSPGPQQISIQYRVAAPGADPARLQALVQEAERRSPVKAALGQAVPLHTTTEID